VVAEVPMQQDWQSVARAAMARGPVPAGMALPVLREYDAA
jgi:hypothetical protein